MATPRRAGRPTPPTKEAEMATEPLSERHRQLLEVLAIAPHGSDVNALLGRGFKLETMADLVRSELAAVRIEIVENHDSKVGPREDYHRVCQTANERLSSRTPPLQPALASQVWGC